MCQFWHFLFLAAASPQATVRIALLEAPPSLQSQCSREGGKHENWKSPPIECVEIKSIFGCHPNIFKAGISNALYEQQQHELFE